MFSSRNQVVDLKVSFPPSEKDFDSPSCPSGKQVKLKIIFRGGGGQQKRPWEQAYQSGIRCQLEKGEKDFIRQPG
jgi:hypothetical protein